MTSALCCFRWTRARERDLRGFSNSTIPFCGGFPIVSIRPKVLSASTTCFRSLESLHPPDPLGASRFTSATLLFSSSRTESSSPTESPAETAKSPPASLWSSWVNHVSGVSASPGREAISERTGFSPADNGTDSGVSFRCSSGSGKNRPNWGIRSFNPEPWKRA